MMNQTQCLPRQSREGGMAQRGGAMPVNNSGQGGQWSIPMPANASQMQ